MMDDQEQKEMDTSISEKVEKPGTKKARKAVFRKTIDFNASVINYLKDRIYLYDWKDRLALQPDYLYNFKLLLPHCYNDCPMTCVTSKLVRTSTNKNKCPIYCVCWTPEGRRLLTGAFSGEITLWNGLTFNFETIQQAHESQIRVMRWSHNDEWLLTADHSGFVKYWQANMNNVEVYQAHKEPIRGASFSPFDSKFATCSDDSTVRIWDFNKCSQERVLRGHGADVRCVAWHPSMSLIVSGSKDAQQPIKLWDPKTGESITTLYVHKSTCTDLAWNKNGNWFLTASRDHLVKLFDIRNLKSELQTFRGHKKDVMRLAWHPIQENVFCSGSGDGAIYFWTVGSGTELSAIEDAHESMIWSLAWHPLGHILASGANDFQTKFWTRDRPGDVNKESSVTNICGVVGLLNPINFNAALSQTTNNNNQTPCEMPYQVGSTEEVVDETAFSGTKTSINIPGIAEGEVENLNVLSAENFDDKKRFGKTIPRTFAANWASIPNNNMPPNQVFPNEHAMSGLPPSNYLPGMMIPPRGGPHPPPPMHKLPSGHMRPPSHHPMHMMPMPGNGPRHPPHPESDSQMSRDHDERGGHFANSHGPNHRDLGPHGHSRQRYMPPQEFDRMGRMPQFYRGGHPPPPMRSSMPPDADRIPNNGHGQRSWHGEPPSHHPNSYSQHNSRQHPDGKPLNDGSNSGRYHNRKEVDDGANLPPRREWGDRGRPPPQGGNQNKRNDW